MSFKDLDTDKEVDETHPISLKISNNELENSAMEQIILKVDNVQDDSIVIPARYTNITQSVNGKDVDYLEIKKYKADMTEVTNENQDAVEYIYLMVKDTAQPAEVTITVTFYDGVTGLETSKSFKVNISA